MASDSPDGSRPGHGPGRDAGPTSFRISSTLRRKLASLLLASACVILWIAGSLLLITPGLVTDTVGLSLGAIGIGSQLLRKKRLARPGTAPAGVA